MRRLNVREAQIDECIQKSMFALSFRPQNPELQPGEPLLLQLVKNDAIRLGKVKERINFALIFDHIEVITMAQSANYIGPKRIVHGLGLSMALRLSLPSLLVWRISRYP